MEDTKRRPSYEKRLGNIRVAVWENFTDVKRWHNTAITRRYKKDDEWREAATFNGHADLALVAECVHAAKSWIAERQDTE